MRWHQPGTETPGARLFGALSQPVRATGRSRPPLWQVADHGGTQTLHQFTAPKGIGSAMTATLVQPSAEKIRKRTWSATRSAAILRLFFALPGDTNELSNAHISVQRSTADLLNNTWDQEEREAASNSSTKENLRI